MLHIGAVATAGLKIITTALALVAIAYGAAALLATDLNAPPPVVDQDELARVHALRDVNAAAAAQPTTYVEVDYAQGPQAPWWPRREAPVLAELSAAGQLPPVAERTGPQPLVLAGCDGIGSYGGSWFRMASGIGDTGVMGWRLSGCTLLRWSTMGEPVVPHAARAVEAGPEARVFTVHLRRGMRWSDGTPLTTRDVSWWWNEDRELAPGETGGVPKFMRVGDATGKVEIVDDYTFRYVFPVPHGLFLQLLAKEHTWCLPAHYLRQYHPIHGEAAVIQAEAGKRGMDATKPALLYGKLKSHLNPHHPRLWPWILRRESADPPYVWVRNPYYWAVDPEGQQLPYLDQIHFESKNAKFIPTAAAQGEVTMQRRHISVNDYTLLMSGREQGAYEVFHWFSATRSPFTVFPNLNRHVDAGDEHARWKAEFLNDRRFRQALSLAIDRESIIRAFGWDAEPGQLDPSPRSPFHSPELLHSFTDYDPARAQALLDEAGLTERDGDGYRAAPDGTRLAFYLNTCSEWTGEGPGPFLIRAWKDVGLRVILRDRARALFNSEYSAFAHDFTVWTGESEFLPLLEPRNFLPTYKDSFFAPRYGIWFQHGGLSGEAEALQNAERAGGLPPPPEHPLRASMQDYVAILQSANADQQQRLWRQIAERAAENVWTISVATHPPQPVVVKHGFANVPRHALDGAGFYTPGNTGIETYYWDRAQLAAAGLNPAAVGAELSPGAQAELSRQMLQISDRYETTAVGAGDLVAEADGTNLGKLIVFLFWGSFVIFILLMAVRHPFVSRRLVIMLPTLLIISIVGFVVIQLPPGDFLETRIAELRMLGDVQALEQAKRLQEQFHKDESPIEQYLRWAGFTWFVTWDSADAGLLQGDLGLSMEDGESVNDKVGDRIVLTMLIAFLSILLTWVIAILTGTYSAVRQYTSGDYLLTFISFIGMSIPGFLLALVLIYVAYAGFGVSITGLFSPEFAAQPEWTWDKFVDLLKHIWVPVLVAGIGGTAGLFRVMRGNLLDELRKPYVTTARAKGVRPMKLLFKYPVRVALNPVVSTIGHIFPELISGSAIVAIVLSLPTVGPMMLDALMTEDMYLAGSMLMVLSLLGIFGTLISDLLLLWLDPRIRMEGNGSR